MTRNLIFIPAILISLMVVSPQLRAQTRADTTELKRLVHTLSELEFQAALSDYVNQLFIEYGVENIPREKYLVSVMRLVNQEMRNRIENPGRARDKYFEELESKLEEIQNLEKRLDNAGISELNTFINELDRRIHRTLKSGEIDYKKMKIFEDALQLLYVAEEMIKMDQMRAPQNLGNKINSSKARLLDAFGEVGETDTVSLKVAPTIFNLFEEWKITREFKYRARMMDVKIARSRLIKSGTVPQIQRMFNNELRMAYTQFNYYNYNQADMLLEDLVETYADAGVKDFEDIYYYWAESNFALSRFMRAQELYEQLLQAYPNSVYLPKVYSRLIQITHKLNRPEEVLEYFARYQNVASSNEKDYFDIQFVAALTHYELGNYNRAVDILLTFPRHNPYYHLAQYMVGTMYAAGQNYDMARDVFLSLTGDDSTPPDIYSRANYKLALISYEQAGYLSAVDYLDQIPESFERYDKVLNALAWSYFKMATSSAAPGETPDFSMAKIYAGRLIDEFYASEHRMEAESLLGYVYQLENKPTMARGFYQEVYESKAMKSDVMTFLEERDQLDSLRAEAQKMKEKALRSNDSRAYVKATDMENTLQARLQHLDLAEMSPVGSAVSQEINDVLANLDELQKLKAVAEEKGNTYAIAKIDSTIIRLTATLDRFPPAYFQKAIAYNWFDAYPVTRKVANYEFSSRKNRQLRNEITDQLALTNRQIGQLRVQIQRARLKNNYKLVAALEEKVTSLMDIRKDFDQLYASTYDLSAGQPYAEFDKWGDFGAFGIIDVNFGQRSRLQEQLTDVSQLYNTVTDVVEERQEVVEDKLKKIEAEIRFMTMKARMQERQRLRAERERAFRETYFDKRTSEFEEK